MRKQITVDKAVLMRELYKMRKQTMKEHAIEFIYWMIIILLILFIILSKVI